MSDSLVSFTAAAHEATLQSRRLRGRWTRGLIPLEAPPGPSQYHEMMPAHRNLVDTKHAQKYRMSCPASLCEMLLKFEGAIPDDTTTYQDADPTGGNGFSKFVDKRLPKNLTMRRIKQAKDWEFPEKEVRAKLAAGTSVGVFLNIPGEVHGWIVDKIAPNGAGEDEIHLVSKYSEDGKGLGKQTAMKMVKLADAPNLKWSDAVYLESLPAPPKGP